MVLQVAGGHSASGCGSAGNLWWLSSLCFMLGARLPRVGSHGDDRSPRTRPKAQAHLKHLFMSYLLTSHCPKQVTQSRQKSKSREVHSALYEVMVRMWAYATTTGECRSETNNSLHHSTHVARCNYQRGEWQSPLCPDYIPTSVHWESRSIHSTAIKSTACVRSHASAKRTKVNWTQALPRSSQSGRQIALAI